MEKTQKCPRCLRGNLELQARSRHDNKTLICNDCSDEEADVNMSPFLEFTLTEEVMRRELRIPLRTSGRWFDVRQDLRPLRFEEALLFLSQEEVFPLAGVRSKRVH